MITWLAYKEIKIGKNKPTSIVTENNVVLPLTPTTNVLKR